MNAGDVDKACKSSGFRPTANEAVTRRNSPQSRAYPGETRNNSRWSRKGKDVSLWERPAGYQLVGKVTAYQGYDV
jgi:hypothetical protein